jgi:serine/threonine protein phosphatase PrpC
MTLDPRAQIDVDLGALSHRGKVRPNNEDCFLVVRTERAMSTLLTNLPAGAVPARVEEFGYGMLVADGIGGLAAGEVASRLALTTLFQLHLQTPDWIMRADEGMIERGLERLAERYRQVDAALQEEARADPKLAGMGTTMTLAYSLGSHLFLGHVGDSRVYFRRGQEFHQLTRDHTCAQALVERGVLRPEDAATHRLRHILTRALGGHGAPVEAEVAHLRLADGDEVLLCSDGLTEMVEDASIEAVLRNSGTSADACRALVDLALQRGGKDNVTVVVARYRFPSGS